MGNRTTPFNKADCSRPLFLGALDFQISRLLWFPGTVLFRVATSHNLRAVIRHESMRRAIQSSSPCVRSGRSSMPNLSSLKKLRRRRHLQVCVWRFTPLGLWSIYKRTRCAGVETSPMISLVEPVRTNRDRFCLICPSLAFFSTTNRSPGFKSFWEVAM